MQDRIQLRFDGMMMGLYQFTEYDESSASYGATFYCPTDDEETVSRRREEKRLQFEQGASK